MVLVWELRSGPPVHCTIPSAAMSMRTPQGQQAQSLVGLITQSLVLFLRDSKGWSPHTPACSAQSGPLSWAALPRGLHSLGPHQVLAPTLAWLSSSPACLPSSVLFPYPVLPTPSCKVCATLQEGPQRPSSDPTPSALTLPPHQILSNPWPGLTWYAALGRKHWWEQCSLAPSCLVSGSFPHGQSCVVMVETSWPTKPPTFALQPLTETFSEDCRTAVLPSWRLLKMQTLGPHPRGSEHVLEARPASRWEQPPGTLMALEPSTTHSDSPRAPEDKPRPLPAGSSSAVDTHKRLLAGAVAGEVEDCRRWKWPLCIRRHPGCGRRLRRKALQLYYHMCGNKNFISTLHLPSTHLTYLLSPPVAEATCTVTTAAGCLAARCKRRNFRKTGKYSLFFSPSLSFQPITNYSLL